MANQDLDQILSQAGLAPALSAELITAGWTRATFGMSSPQLADLENHWADFFPDRELTFLEKAQMRVAWQACRDEQNSEEASLGNPPVPPVASTPTEPPSSWTETFAPKLSSTVVTAMKAKFLSSYPSEILTQDTMPSLRLLSQVHYQLQKKEVKWIPWKYRLSQSRADEVTTGRGSKQPRLEGLSLHSLIYDEPPSIEVSNQSMGVNAVRSIFDLFNVAVALAEGAHLAHLKAYSLKFLGYLTQKYDPDTGLRTPSIMEAQAADKHLWFLIGELVMDKNWSLDQALHEMTYIRSDMAMLLQARPRMNKPAAVPVKGSGKSSSSWSTSSPPQQSSGGGKKGKAKGKTKGGVKWLTEAVVDGQKKQLCMRYQNGSCTFNDCKFHHGCAYPKADGSACGLSHPAMQHASTPHWLDGLAPPSIAIVVSDDEDKSVSPISPNDAIPQGTSTDFTMDSMQQPPLDLPQGQPSGAASFTSQDMGGHSKVPTTTPERLDTIQQESSCPSRIFLDICSGSNRPLSKAILAQGGDVCSVDILLCQDYDLLNDAFYLKLLRLAASGRIAYAACSPSCNEYSVLKLKPGGPPALRSQEFLDGLPNLTADQLSRVQNSHLMLFRCTELLQVVLSAGGHGHLEQPPSAMSWLENCTQKWLLSGGYHCIHLAACAFGRNWPKSWMFASSFAPLISLACLCEHPPGHHPPLAGVRDETGGFLSRRTAEYPEQLADKFAQIVLPLVRGSGMDFSVSALL